MTSLNRFYRLFLEINSFEEKLLRMTHIYTTINQIIFFVLCDRTVGSHERVNSLYTLMQYNVIAYCFQYIKDMIEKEDWYSYVNVSQHSNVLHLAMSTTKLLLEWTKAVTFVITIAFLALSFAAKEGLEKYRPTFLYTVFTLSYYIATEKTFLVIFPKVLCKLQVEAFESLEILWVSTILKSYSIITSAFFALTQFFRKNYGLAVFGIYVNVILSWKDANRSCFQKLKKELKVLEGFRNATCKELLSFDDVCSVCLSPMKAAKVTPCKHFFHAGCLRKCLKSQVVCPICKRQFY